MSDEFTFLHAADLHLDSPLVGLSGRAAYLAARVGCIAGPPPAAATHPRGSTPHPDHRPGAP